MRTASVYLFDRLAGRLSEIQRGRRYRFVYEPDYDGPAVSLAMPVSQRAFDFTEFPPFFDGLLPEGVLLEALLRQRKIDRDDRFGQLLAVGADTVGAATIVGDTQAEHTEED
jgi:serine/threonine-protein kinase HipA